MSLPLPDLIPPLPSPLDGEPVQGPVSLRYEDVQQEGRLTLVGVPHALGELVWPAVMAHPFTAQNTGTGVIPILSRMVIQVGGGPISALQPLWGQAAWHRDAVRGPDGAPSRLQLMMWVDLYGQEGWTLLPPEPQAPRVLAGRIYAEHTFTRLFAGPGERRVTSLEGWEPQGSWPERRPEEVAPPSSSTRRHTRSVRFGLLHTDPNSHVNSLVYPRIFEEAALHLRGSEQNARLMEVMWRKPFFAGETTHIEQWITDEGQVHGCFLDDAGAPRARMRMGW